jgi:hypothetical protein
VVSFTPQPLYPGGKRPRYALGRRLGGPQSLSGRRRVEKNLALSGTSTTTPHPFNPYPVAIPTASRLPGGGGGGHRFVRMFPGLSARPSDKSRLKVKTL